MTIGVANGNVLWEGGIIHFAIPAKRWWEDIVFT